MPDNERAIEVLAAELSRAYRSIPSLVPTPSWDSETISQEVQRVFDFKKKTPLSTLVEDVARLLQNGLIHVTHPRHYGFFNPSVDMASVVADALASVYNPQLAVWAHAPAAMEIEAVTLRFLMDRLGFPVSADGHFTTGGTEANHTALLAALNHRFEDYAERGLLGLGALPRIYISDQGHESFIKIVQMAGLSRAALRRVPTDANYQMDLEALRAMIAEDRTSSASPNVSLMPLMIVATAGSTTLGAIDPLESLAEIAGNEDLWLHVDAAWGGAAVVSDALRPALSGIERADSVTCDAHKWFSVSMGAGMFFCRHPEALTRAFQISTAYMPDAPDQHREPYLNTMQWSRRFIGLKLAVTLAELGASGMAERIDHQAAMGDRLRAGLIERGFDVVHRSPFPLVCFKHPKLESERQRGNDLYPKIASQVQSAGHWIASVRVREEPVLRACITSFRTGPDDIDALVEALLKAVNSNR